MHKFYPDFLKRFSLGLKHLHFPSTRRISGEWDLIFDTLSVFEALETISIHDAHQNDCWLAFNGLFEVMSTAGEVSGRLGYTRGRIESSKKFLGMRYRGNGMRLVLSKLKEHTEFWRTRRQDRHTGLLGGFDNSVPRELECYPVNFPVIDEDRWLQYRENEGRIGGFRAKA